MKISELKQPYKRMAEYLAEKNTYKEFTNKDVLVDAFCWHSTNHAFWIDIDGGEYPPITKEIKKHFPPDFDFSGDVEDEKRYNFAFKNNMEEKYTQLVKDGKFDQLPDTCEFSEPVELEVSGESGDLYMQKVYGKFKGKYVLKHHLSAIRHAQLPTQKIDFSEFKLGDVVEVELSNEENRIGWFDYADRGQVVIKTLKRKGNQVCNGGSCSGSKMFNLEKIKSITKIK